MIYLSEYKKVSRSILLYAFLSQIVAKGMIARGNGGSIVNISSVSSTRGEENALSYCTTKGALDQVTRVFALELGPHQVYYVKITFRKHK